MPLVLAIEFLAIYPEFGSIAQTTIDYWLSLSEEVHCPSTVWTEPAKRRLGVMLRTAHYLESQQQQMAATASMGAAVSLGQSTSISGGGFSDLDQTVYGRQYNQLRKTIARTGFAF